MLSWVAPGLQQELEKQLHEVQTALQQQAHLAEQVQQQLHEQTATNQQLQGKLGSKRQEAAAAQEELTATSTVVQDLMHDIQQHTATVYMLRGEVQAKQAALQHATARSELPCVLPRIVCAVRVTLRGLAQ